MSDTMRDMMTDTIRDLDAMRDLSADELECVGGGISGISFVNINFDVRYLALLARHPW